jgi:hypothetical protein
MYVFYAEVLPTHHCEPHNVSCRLALVAAFLVSPFGAAERTWKPFNPLLGETFELEGLGSNVRFMAEQVSRGTLQCCCCWHKVQCCS